MKQFGNSPFKENLPFQLTPYFCAKFSWTPFFVQIPKTRYPPPPPPPLILGKERKISICLFTYAITVYKFDWDLKFSISEILLMKRYSDLTWKKSILQQRFCTSDTVIFSWFNLLALSHCSSLRSPCDANLDVRDHCFKTSCIHIFIA